MQVWTYNTAMAAARDAANRRMKNSGRQVWDESDYAFAATEFHRLMGLK